MSQVHEFNERNYQAGTPFYNYTDSSPRRAVSTSPAEASSAREGRSEKLKKFLKVLIVLLVFVIIMQVAYHLYFARNLRISKIVIETGIELDLTDRQVLQMAGLTGSESYFSLDPAEVQSRLERYPQIASAAVEKHFPGTLIVNLDGRTPVAVCLIESGEVTVPAAVDSEGVIFRIDQDVSALNLPVLSGVKLSGAGLGSRMPSAVRGFLEQLDRLGKDSPVFYNSISEFKFIKKINEDFEVLMYPQNYSIPVRIGNRIDKNLFTYVILVLDVVKNQGMSEYLEELDFRTDEVVYKIRGE